MKNSGGSLRRKIISSPILVTGGSTKIFSSPKNPLLQSGKVGPNLYFQKSEGFTYNSWSSIPIGPKVILNIQILVQQGPFWTQQEKACDNMKVVLFSSLKTYGSCTRITNVSRNIGVGFFECYISSILFL